ncbi:MAG TPA: hypothetical protein VHZ81_05765 [Galbitalea sp.]|jgi:hypothetical protein|nr:hypothetical protein [Galbitalea sp.]
MTYSLLGKKLPAGLVPRSRAGRAIASGVIGLALAAGLATPAFADPAPDPAPDPTPQALTDYSNVTSTGTPDDVTPTTNGSHLATPATVIGKRQTFTRGGTLAWSSDTFEWYWSGSTMTSSTAFQQDGYVFPNTVTLLGVKRTLASSSQHLWRGTASIGAGVITPWGTVNVYSQTITDYFTLTPGKLTHSNS